MVTICHMTCVHQRYDTRIFQKECRSLAANGYDVSLIVADGKGDKAQGHIIDNAEGFHLLKAGKTEAADSQRPQAAGADQHTGNQISGHVRHMQFHKQTGHQQPREQRGGNKQ